MLDYLGKKYQLFIKTKPQSAPTFDNQIEIYTIRNENVRVTGNMQENLPETEAHLPVLNHLMNPEHQPHALSI